MKKCSGFLADSDRSTRNELHELQRLTKLFKLLSTAVGSDIPLLDVLLRFWCFLLLFWSLSSFSLEPLRSSASSSGVAVMLFGVSGVFKMKLLAPGDVGIRISSKLRLALSLQLKLFLECLSLESDDVRLGCDLSTDR